MQPITHGETYEEALKNGKKVQLLKCLNMSRFVVLFLIIIYLKIKLSLVKDQQNDEK